MLKNDNNRINGCLYAQHTHLLLFEMTGKMLLCEIISFKLLIIDLKSGDIVLNVEQFIRILIYVS